MSETEKPTRPYRPSNGTEGESFISQWCAKCEYEERARQDETCSGCEVLGATMAFDIDDEHYPGEWVSDLDGRNPRCTKFRKVGSGTWEQFQADQARYNQAMAEMRAAAEQTERAAGDDTDEAHERALTELQVEQDAMAREFIELEDAAERQRLEAEEMAKHYERHPHG